MLSRKLLVILLASTAAVTAQPAHAQSTDDIGVELLQLLVDEGVIPAQKAQDLLTRAKQVAELRRQRETPPSATTIDVPYVPETVRVEMKQQIKAEVMAEAKQAGWVAPNSMPEWLSGIKISGDFRLRYEGDFFPRSDPKTQTGNFPSFPDFNAINQMGGVNNTAGFPILNSTVDRHSARYRVRLGIAAKVNDFVSVGLQLASGNDSGAISTNQLLGDYFNKDRFWIDRAFVTLTPVKGVNLTGGRMPNPFYSTDMVWDTDINPEGIALDIQHRFGSATVFARGGAFPLQELDLYNRDRWLFAGQVGVEGRIVDDVQVKAAVAYYDFHNVNSLKNAPDGSRLNDYTAPGVLAKGNSLFNMRTDGLTTLAGLASDFKLLNVTGSVTYTGFGDIPVRLTGDVVKNRALISRANLLKLDSNSLIKPGGLGWQARLDVGKDRITKFGDWHIAAGYKHVETDAVLDIFTDSDFGLGGTDVEGYLVEAEMGIYPGASIGVNWFSTNSIERAPFSVDVLQLNLSAHF
ncbi:MAG: putative porin [Pseudomonadota bacterium]|uniref:putative porin n=1 Tax=Sphingomonas sp. ERG5 TaxID=1381597 RepID=UPI00054C5B4E|nr:putative porin [Sphingomonas sp. ERG5]